jgi:hypothetical protein
VETPSEHDHWLTQLTEQQRAAQQRWARRLAELMEERSDLRGVCALADLVDDGLRWSA